MLLITCKTGGEHVYVAPGDENRDPHSRLDLAGCDHCADQNTEHHHGMNANLCPKAHEGPCWNPPTVPVRPEGCSVCRPLSIEAMPGTISAGLVTS